MQSCGLLERNPGAYAICFKLPSQRCSCSPACGPPRCATHSVQSCIERMMKVTIRVSAALNPRLRSQAWQQGRLQFTSASGAGRATPKLRCYLSTATSGRLLKVSHNLQWSVTPRNREVLRLPLRSTCTVVVDFLLLLQVSRQEV
jgi:hypothetical protein